MQPQFDSNFDREDQTTEFLRLLSQHERSLYAYILALCPNWADADDLAQETRIRLWRQFDKYLPGSDFGAWARSVAYFLVLAHRERAGRSRLCFNPKFYESVATEISAKPSLIVARQSALSQCMEKLDSMKRDMIERHYAGNQSLRELAELMGQSYEATRKSVYRTQLMLAACIDSELQKKGDEP